MDEINTLTIIALLALFLSLFLALFLATFLVSIKTKHRVSNYLFAAFLILTGIDIGGVLIEFIVQNPSNVGMLRKNVTFLQIPVFYLYIMSVCYSDFRLKFKHLIHVAPFLIVNLVLLPRYYLRDISSKISFLENSHNMVEVQFNYTLLHIQIVVYMFAAFMVLKKSKKLYLENFTGININSYHWLFQLTIALAIFYSLAFLKNIFIFSYYPEISEWLKIGLFLFQLLIVSWYLFKALNNPSLFRNVDSRLKLVADIVLEERRDKQPEKLENNYNENLLLLKDYMEKEKPFLNPSITIQNISDEIQIPVRDLSLLINHKLGQHFFDFVNTYRIENAMFILKDPTKSKITVLEILYEVGFNSKSSFNTAFKKHTGTTPTEFRKRMQTSKL